MLRRDSITRLLLGPLAVAIVLAIAVRTVVRVYSIPSRSMEPTLAAGDRIAVIPYFGEGRPQRGDVVVFRSPSTPEEYLVKRVVAVPGDLIACAANVVTIGGHPIAEPYLEAASTTVIPPQIIPQDCYFVMGDNRAVSFDSRSWGVLPRELIVGRARMVLWSSHRVSTTAAAFAASGESTAAHSHRRRPRLFVPIR